jgi:UDP-2-acetamido-3-amino-2,3-dideoxy-glucuronate N-acetyltransferase
MRSTDTFIHPTAVIDSGAQVGDGTKIWHFSHLMATSKIGERCIIGQNVYIDSDVNIGNEVKIQNNVSVYNGVEIEDGVFLGPSVVFTNVINPRSFIERKDEFKKTIVRKGATIGANATILCGIEIGAYAMIGAGAVVTKNVLAFAVMMGNPARRTAWISEAGIKLQFADNGVAICPHSGRRYKLENGIVDLAQ